MLRHQSTAAGLLITIAVAFALGASLFLSQRGVESLLLPILLAVGAGIVFLSPSWGLFGFLLLSPLKIFEIGRGILSVGRLLGIGVGSVIIIRSVVQRRALRATGIEGPVILIATGMALSFFRSNTDTVLTAQTILSIISLYGVVFVIVNLVKDEAQLKSLVIAFMASAVYPIVFAANDWFSGPLREDARISGTFTGPNGMGGFLVLVLVLTIALLVYRRFSASLTTMLLLGMFVTEILVLIATFSRSAWAGTAAGITLVIYFLWSRAGSGRGHRVAPFILILIFTASIWPFWSLIEGRLVTPISDLITTGESSKSVLTRRAEIQYTFFVIWDNLPLGSGIGNYPLAAAKARDTYPGAYYLPDTAHSGALKLFAEAGLMSGIGFLWLITRLYKLVRRYHRLITSSGPSLVYYVYIGSLASLVGYIGMIFFLGGIFTNEVWVAMGLMITSTRIATNTSTVAK